MSIAIDKYTVTADQVDKVVISGVPVGASAKVSIGDGVVVAAALNITDGLLEITFDTPGAYAVAVRGGQAEDRMDWETEINAT